MVTEVSVAGTLLLPESEALHWLRRNVHGVRVLQVGCGRGELCLALGRDGLMCTGLEWRVPLLQAAAAALAAAPQPVRWRASLHAGDAACLPFPDGTFDTVILSDGLPQSVQPEQLLREARRVLRETGVVLITVPFGLTAPPVFRQAAYPFSLLEYLQTHFHGLSLEVKSRHLCYCGRKAPLSSNSTPGGVTKLLSLWLLARELEERCWAAETALAAQNGDLAVHRGLAPELKRAPLAAGLQPETRTAMADQYDRPPAARATLEQSERRFRAALLKQQAEFNQALAAQEALIKRAWNWRVGGAILAPVKLLTGFVRDPLGFPSRAKQLARDYCETVFPRPLRLPAPAAPVAKPAPSQKVPDGAVTVGAILDEFTTASLRPECQLVAFRPDNWRPVLEQERPQALFVESAWNGNDGAWQYRIAHYDRKFGDELKDVLTWARAEGIPSAFWNKEDPVHFDRFIDNAGLFDVVFTSDANLLRRYSERLGHKRVFALPFAAQPQLHNPILAEPRDRSVCFAGAYYGDRHAQRRHDLEHILKPALDFELDIYDRQYGMVGKAADLYRFPDIYQPYIRGRLDYADMVQAYKRYRVFLNVNSVTDSPTMFSRRVFELLACGTPVISSHAQGIVELFGDDTVFLSESEADTRRHLERLLSDDDAWARASVRGIRAVMRTHTYAHRFTSVLAELGVPHRPVALPRLAVLARISSHASTADLLALLESQTCQPTDIVLLLDASDLAGGLEALRNAVPETQVTALAPEAPDRYARCLAASAAGYLAVLDPRDYYGPNYLLDCALAAMYSGQDFIGRHTHFNLAHGGAAAGLQQAGREFQLVASVPTSTLVFRRTAMTPVMLAECLAQTNFQPPGRQVLSIDRFNYLAVEGTDGFAERRPVGTGARQQVEV